MLFLGTFLGGDVMSIPCTPTECSSITSVKLDDGMYDNLYITQNVTENLTPQFPDSWDFKTILYAKYNSSANAGNVDWSLDTVSQLLIKRREKNKFKWQVIDARPINHKEDFNFQGTDHTNAAQTDYEYAVVPSFHGIEGSYDSIMVTSDFDDVFIISPNGMIHTGLTDGFCNMSRNTFSNTLTTLHSKYPIKIRNSIASYDTGTFTGSFLPYSKTNHAYSFNDKERTDYQSKIIDFLSDGTAKLLKLSDSRIKLISIDDNITNSADSHYQNREISFDFTEIGNIQSQKDLYDFGLTTVTEEWW